MSVPLLRRLFTVKEYHKMVEAGVFSPDDQIELIQGEIIKMSPIGKRHAATVNRLVRLFTQLLGEDIILSPQNPIELNNNSEPQPDIALLLPRSDFYESKLPQPQDVLLLVEVADTTANYDREVKIPVYAQGGITEVWLVDINQQCVEVYREPISNRYQNMQKLRRGEFLSIQFFRRITNSHVTKAMGRLFFISKPN